CTIPPASARQSATRKRLLAGFRSCTWPSNEMDDPGASSAPPGAAGRCRPASGPPTDHGVMTPSHAGETHSCYRQADEGDQAERPRLSAIRRGRAGVDIAAQGGMLLPSSTGPAVGVGRGGRPAGPGPAAQLTRRQAQPGGPARPPGWAGGWRREGPGRPLDNGERAAGRRRRAVKQTPGNEPAAGGPGPGPKGEPGPSSGPARDSGRTPPPGSSGPGNGNIGANFTIAIRRRGAAVLPHR